MVESSETSNHPDNPQRLDESHEDGEGPQSLRMSGSAVGSAGRTSDQISSSLVHDTANSLADANWSLALGKTNQTAQGQHTSNSPPNGDATAKHPDANQDSESATPPRARGIYWTTPTLMLLAFISGVALSVSHHFYYDHFNGRAVGKQSQQTWILRGGSAFGFGVKLSLVIATGTAYTQQFWISLRSSEASVKNVDSMFTALRDVTELLDLKLWFGRPVLAVPALVCWLVPIVAIITPGALVVEPHLRNKTTPLRVPQLNLSSGGVDGLWASLNYNLNYHQDENIRSLYNIVAPEVSRLVLASAAQGRILPLIPPVSNSTYVTTFNAPAFNCVQASSSDVQDLESALYDYGPIYYISWTPNELYPYIGTPDTSHVPFDPFDQTYGVDFYSNVSARLFVYTGYSHSAFTCYLRNMSLTVSFEFQNGEQSITVERNHDNGGVAAPFTGRDVTDGEVPYLALMDAIGHILVGQITGFGAALTSVASTSINDALVSTNSSALGPAIEKMFEMATISLLSHTSYQQSATLSPLVSVRTSLTQTTYIYRPKDLYLAYGLGILAAFICIMIGINALLRNGYSHTNNFSTIMRTTRDGAFDKLVSADQAGGADPLPRSVGNARVLLRSKNEKGFEVVP